MTYDKLLDVTGLSCPMPIVKARQEIENLTVGQVLKVLATDRGSVKDFQGWAEVSSQVELIHQSTEEQNGEPVYVHFMQRKA